MDERGRSDTSDWPRGTGSEASTGHPVYTSSGATLAQDISIVIGGSAHVQLAPEIAQMVNTAYGYARVSVQEVCGRLERGGDEQPNRVLHLAFRGPQLVGCVSSTLQTGWTPSQCGHWGLLVAARAAQGTGIGRALIRAAELRLVTGGCTHVQIEYEYSAGDAYSQRLCHWYEARLGFTRNSYWLLGRLFGMLAGHRPSTEFRTCRKELSRCS